MKILVGYYCEKEIEVDDKFLPLEEKDEYTNKEHELLCELAKKIKRGLSNSSDLYYICDSHGNVIFEQ